MHADTGKNDFVQFISHKVYPLLIMFNISSVHANKILV